ncbi:MAG TPA: single-stranded-DNA-specific exonuclease RecJ [Gammaproteobacteria bacterium]|nr:single-stranded-DNA-specific exonuclease RecJ [Gammaproteobacteria bacterium]
MTRTAMKRTLKRREFSHEQDILSRIYSNRGIESPDELNTDLSQLLNFDQLLNIDKAAEIIGEGIRAQEKFLILGDFDTDGATSTTLAVSALKALGAKHVDYLIPNRFEYGYGLSPEIVDLAATRHPDILITVDNGISSHEGVKKAKEYGMKVVVTDHHLSGETLPEADVIINPNQPNDVFESKHIAGVGVIFYVMLATRKYLKSAVSMGQFLDLVALGTVADVVVLDKNNRILVTQGIKRIRAGLARPGIYALLKVGKREAPRVRTSDLGFAVAPRLNAAGRLEDMSLGVACLLSDNDIEAFRIAIELDSLNKNRREIESDMLINAEKIVERFDLDEIPASICLFHPEFHQGVIGILAGRLKDRYHRPTFIFSKVNDTELKSSARSIPGLHLRDILALMDTRHPGLIKKFGGHAMAAGLTLPIENLDNFSSILNSTVLEKAEKHNFENILLTDGELNSTQLTLENAQLLCDHAPWGQGFPEPLFEGEFEVLNQKLIQDKHLKLVLTHPAQSHGIEAMLFNYGDTVKTKNIKIAYRLDINHYNNQQKLQLMIEYLET